MSTEYIAHCYCPYCGSELPEPQPEPHYAGYYTYESFCAQCDDMIDADWMRIEHTPADRAGAETEAT